MAFPVSSYNYYSALVTLTNSQNNEIYQERFHDPKEFNKFISAYGKSNRPWGLCKACLIPVRTELKDLSKDLFLPTVINRALKLNSLIKRIIATLAAAFLDVMTFPFRLFTVIPRALYNYFFQKDHPLYDFFREKNIDNEKWINEEKLTFNCQITASVLGDNTVHDVWQTLNKDVIEKTNPSDTQLRVEQMLFNRYFMWSSRVDENLANITSEGKITITITHTESIEKTIYLKVIPESQIKLTGKIDIHLSHLDTHTFKWTDHNYSYPINYSFTEL